MCVKQKRPRPLIVLAAISVAASTLPACARMDSFTAFGRKIVVVAPRTEEGRIEIDGRAVHKNWSLSIDEVAVVSGTPVLIGSSGPGGNSCEATPFIISFPEGKAPRFDGPVDTCWLVTQKLASDRIMFSTPAMPDVEGQNWTWTAADGLRSDGKVKFAPTAAKGWGDLRDRSLRHPMDLFDYGAVTTRAEELVGDRRKEVLATMNGPGSGRYEGDWFIGDACQSHNCPGPGSGSGSIVVVDIQGRRLFLAWKPNEKKIEVRPAIGEWPTEARRPLATWAKLFEPHKAPR